MSRRVSYLILALLAALVSFPDLGPAALRIGAMFFVFGYLPGALIAPHLVPTWGRSGRTLISLGISPFLSGGIGTLLLAGSLSPAQTARIVAGALSIATLVVSFMRERTASRAKGERVAWLSALAWTVAVAVILFGNPILITRSDSWFHCAVTLQIAGIGAIPPEDPFFAGLRLLYFWGSHVWAALWLPLQSGLPAWGPLVALNLAGAAATILGACGVARRLGAGDLGMGMAAVVVVAGHAPLSWGWVIAQSLVGEVRGLDAITHILGNGIQAAMSALQTGLLHLSLVFLGGKFLVLTSFGIGLALLFAFLLCLLDLVERPSVRTLAALSTVTASALFLHTVVGLTCVALAFCWSGWRIVVAISRGELSGLGAPLLPALSVALSALLLFPYLRVVAAGHGGALFDGIIPANFLSWALAGVLIVPAGMIWLARNAQTPGPAREILIVAIFLTGASLLLNLPGDNQSKFLNLLFVILSPAAGIGLTRLLSHLRGARRTLFLSALVVTVLPTVGISIWAYASEEGAIENGGRPPAARVREAYNWARANLPDRAIFVDGDGFHEPAVWTGRSVLWGGATRGRNWGYAVADLGPREKAARELTALTEVSPETRRFLERLERDLVVVVRPATDSTPDQGWEALVRPPEGYEPIFANERIGFLRWTGAPMSGLSSCGAARLGGSVSGL